jgi:hypothetical protein
LINSYTDKIYSKLLQFKLINNRRNLPIFLSINKKSQNLSCSVEYAFTLDSLTKFCEMKLMENIEPKMESIKSKRTKKRLLKKKLKKISKSNIKKK